MKANVLLFLWAIIAYVAIGYSIPRTSFEPFACLYGSLFAAYFYWCYQAKSTFKEAQWPYYLAAAVVFRGIFLLATPELSDDFWRYLWDGRLLSNGINPYRFIPSELISTELYQQAHLEQLYAYLNSPDFYSVYPPITQLVFTTSTFFFTDNVWASLIMMSSIVLLLEIGTIVVLVKLLKALNQPIYYAFLYAFNPLIIIELSGNLHTESIMIFFLVLAFYKMSKEQLVWAALSFSVAVGAKLLPLMFMPIILHRYWFKEGIKFCLIVGAINLILVGVFFDLELLLRIRASMALYFGHFEFNASIYYAIRYWLINEYWHLWDYHEYFQGFTPLEELLKYDLYVVLRKVLPIIDLCLIVRLSLKKEVRQSFSYFLRSFLFIYSIHFFLATTIHPWYISTLVLFTVLTSYRYVLVWTAFAGFTYISYQGEQFAENSMVIGVEYLLVFVFLIWELRTKKIEKIALVKDGIGKDNEILDA